MCPVGWTNWKRDMKNTIRIFVSTLLFNALVVLSPSSACTIISASHGEKVFFGGNEDQALTSSFLVVDNRETYRALYFATLGEKNQPVMQMGVNEMGLSFDVNRIPEAKLNPHPDRKSPDELLKNILGKLASVEEVLSLLPVYDWGASLAAQFHFADKTGDAAVIYPGADPSR